MREENKLVDVEEGSFRFCPCFGRRESSLQRGLDFREGGIGVEEGKIVYEQEVCVKNRNDIDEGLE